MSQVRFQVRPMRTSDLEPVSRLAGALVRLHHGFDQQRFLHLQDPEGGYARYFASELEGREAILVVAEREAAILGYVYARMEPRSYDELRDACGKIHDVFVDDAARGQGVGEALVREAMRCLADEGAPRVVLLTAVQNEAAQRLFARLGFRTTMLEMTSELVSPPRT